MLRLGHVHGPCRRRIGGVRVERIDHSTDEEIQRKHVAEDDGKHEVYGSPPIVVTDLA